MNEELLKYYLIRNIPIPYQQIKIQQPSLNGIDELEFNLADYNRYTFIFCLSKEYLKIEEENISVFEIMFTNQQFLSLLIESISWFTRTDLEYIKVNILDKTIQIINNDKKLFYLDNNNFEEFSNIIRTICNAEILKENKVEYKVKKYKNKAIQEKMEKMLKNLKEQDKKKAEEEYISFSDIINQIATSKYSKYTLLNIGQLSVWQIYNVYKSMMVIEGKEFLKNQYCSYKFEVDVNKVSFDWSKEIKIKLKDI